MQYICDVKNIQKIGAALVLVFVFLLSLNAQSPKSELIETPAPIDPTAWEWETILLGTVVLLIIGIVIRAISLANKAKRVNS